MSILNVNQIQPLGGGNTITVSANDVNFSGNISIGSSFVGTASTASLATSAQGLTGTPDITVGNIQSGVVTATTFIGDGSGLTGVTASGSGINIKDSGSTVGVAATIDFSTNLNVSPASAGIVTVTVGDTDFAIADKIIHTGDTNTAIRFPAADTITAETAGSERFRITSDGDVGIGTETPGAILEVFDATSNTILNVKSGDSGAVLNLIDDSARSSIEQNGTTLKISSDTGAEDKADSDIILQVDGSSKMIIRNSGDIVTGVPGNDNQNNTGSRTVFTVADTTNGALLHVRGQSPAIFFDQSSSGTGKVFLDSADFAIQSGTPASEGTERLRITSDGKVGIGTDNPEYKTTIAADGANAKLNIKRKTAAASNGNAFGSLFYTNSDGTDVASIRAHRESAADDAYLGFATRNTGGSISEKLRIDSSGRVGINTNTFNDDAEALRVQAPSGQSNTHLTIKAGSTSGYSVLNFGDNDFNEGRIKYDHSSNTMEFFADDTGFMKYEDDNTVGGGRSELTSNGTYLTASTVDYYVNAGSTRTYGLYVHKNNTGGTYGIYSYTLGGNSTQYSIGGQVNTTSTYSSGGVLGYSINSNTYGILGYWSGGGSGAYYTFMVMVYLYVLVVIQHLMLV